MELNYKKMEIQLSDYAIHISEQKVDGTFDK